MSATFRSFCDKPLENATLPSFEIIHALEITCNHKKSTKNRCWFT